jgi:uncharacterized membrane protein YphA (DoxX/SURF4 family)
VNAISTIARWLLALVFIVFGLNGFLHFIPQPPPPSEMARQYFTVLFLTKYLHFAFALQLVGGVLFLFKRTTPLALVIIGPILVNILLFHSLMNPEGIVPGAVATVLWAVVFWRYLDLFKPILVGARPDDARHASLERDQGTA